MPEDRPKPGLGKEISSIFSGLPEIDNGRGGPSVPGPSVPPLPSVSGGEIFPGQTEARMSFDGAFPAQRNSVIGLDIGQSAIKLVQLTPVPGGWEIGGWLIAENELEKTEDGLESKESLLGRLKEAVAAAGIKNRSVVASLRGDNINTSLAAFAPMARKELLAAARLEAKRRVAFNVEKALIHPYRLSGEASRPGGKQNFLITAARKESLARRLGAAGDAGLHVLAMLPQPFAWKEWLADSGEKEDRVRAVIDVASDRTVVSVYQADQIRFCREFQPGGDEITRAIIHAGTSFGAKVEISRREAERVKSEFDLISGVPGSIVKGTLSLGQVGGMVRPVLERIVQESLRSLDYFAQIFGGREVDSVILAGGGALLPGFERFFQEKVRAKVGTARLPERWKLHPSLRDTESLKKVFPRLARAATLALARKPEVNLVPPADILIQRLLKSRAAFITLVVALFAFSFLFYYTQKRQIPTLRALVETGEKELGDLRKGLGDYQDLEKLRQQIAEREKLGLVVEARQPHWNGIFQELSRLVPDRVVLGRMYLIEGLVPLKMVCEGRVLPGPDTPDAVFSGFVTKIEKSPFFRDVKQWSIDPKDKKTQTPAFSLTFTLVY